MKCKIAAVIAAAAMCFLLTARVFAEAEDYGTEIPSGAEAADSGEAAENGADLVYSSETELYTFTFDNGETLYSTAALSADSDISYLWLSWSENVEVILMLNGEDIGYTKGSILSESGSYTLYAISDVQTVQFSFSLESEMSVKDGRFSGAYENGRFSADGITSNVLDGETIAFPAEISVEDNYICTVTHGEDTSTMSRSIYLSEDGDYSLIFTDMTGGKIYRLSFVIMQKPSGNADIFTVPAGYEITSAAVDGEEIPHGRVLLMDKDGKYEIAYSNGTVNRTMTIVRDTKAPVLYFNGGRSLTFSDPVVITADGEYTYEILKDGYNYTMRDDTLSASGIYRINASDEAGNTATYRVVIEAKSGVAPAGIIISSAVVVIILAAYFIYHKTHPLRVK